MSMLSPSVASSSGCSSYTINNYTQNLASVLSDARRSKAEVNAFFTRHWGEDFVPRQNLPQAPTIPSISLEHFRHYLENTAKKHRQYLRARKTLLFCRSNVMFFGDRISRADIPEVFFSSSFSDKNQNTFEILFLEPKIGQLDKLISEVEKKGNSNAQESSLRRPESCGSLNSMQSVQNMVSAAEACQGRMFRVCQRLQTRLEHYDDVVSALLNQQLEAKKEQFWRTINSYCALHCDLEAAIERTRTAREKLARSREELCQRSERILSLQNARLNRQKLLSRLHEIACLRDAQTTVQILLSQGDIPRALECIDTAQEVLANDLRGVNCFRHLSSQLDELVIAIGKVLREEFLAIIQKEFAWPIEERTGEGLQRKKEEMRQVISSLLRCAEFRFMLMLRGEIEEAAKNTTRQVVKSSLLECTDNAVAIGLGSSSLSDQIGQLTDVQWAQTLRSVLHSLSLLCRRVYMIQCLIVYCTQQNASTQQKSLIPIASPTIANQTRSRCNSVDNAINGSIKGLFEPFDPRETKSECAFVADTESGKNLLGKSIGGTTETGSGSQSSQNKKTQQQLIPEAGSILAMPCYDISQLINVAPLLVEYAIKTSEERVAKLLTARYRDVILEHCPPSAFHKMCKMVTEFVKNWHKINELTTPENDKSSNQRSPAQIIIQQLTIKFISKFSETKRQQLNAVIDAEPWRPIDIPPIFQRIINRYSLNGVLSDVEDDQNDDGRDENKDCLIFDGGKRYVVVGAATLLLRILAQYCDMLALFPHCAMEMMMDVVQMLKAFNSRTCQLILGAGALQLVGLKTISVKHLALASRSLQFVAQLIPTIRQSFCNQLPVDRQNLLRHFDLTQRDFNDHVNEIRNKLLGMMDRELIRALEEWKLEGKAPTASFQQIVMQIGKFYSGYSTIMPSELTTEILHQIHANFKIYLRQHLNARGISPHDSITYGMACQDFAYYLENVSALPDCKSLPEDTIGDVLQLK